MMNNKEVSTIKTINRKKVYNHLLLVCVSAVMVFPIVWWVLATFKPLSELSANTFWPHNFIFDNYINGWHISDSFTFLTFFRNSLLISCVNVIGAVLTSGFVAYGFGRLHFKFQKFWFSVLILTLMLPSQVTVVSQYIMYNKLHLIDSYIPLITPYCLGGGAFFIFMVVQFIRGIPRDLDEAATIDGAGRFMIYWRIIFPLLKAPLVTVAIYAFTWSWDDFYSQLLYINSVSKYTVSLGLRLFIDQADVKWGELFAMSLLSLIPALILFFTQQKEFVAGISTTGLKG